MAAAFAPGKLILRETGLRDGLQLVKVFPPTRAKLEWIREEYDAGVRYFELGSFLPPSSAPQFADVREIIDAVAALPGAHGSVLTLNERAVHDALTTSVQEIVCIVSASEAHNQANMRRSREQAVELIRKAVAACRESSTKPLVSVGIAVAFGCSISGTVDPDTVIAIAEACLEAGADMVGIADTVGYAGPRQVAALTARLVALSGDRPVGVHLHDTRGMGIANAAAAIDSGARILDGSLGGLGGCPAAPGATGNVVFEDLVYLAETMGYRTHIDIERLAAARRILKAHMAGEKLYGALARAGVPKLAEWRGYR